MALVLALRRPTRKATTRCSRQHAHPTLLQTVLSLYQAIEVPFAFYANNDPAKNITYVPGIDISTPDAGPTLLKFLHSHKITHLDIVLVTAGYFATESLKEPSFDAQEKMYRTCVIGPTILTTALANDSDTLLDSKTKIIFLSSESGSITLRHESEGGGNYGHHASKTALNMSVKLLSLDLKERGVAVVAVHPGFMRTEMTKGVGFDKFWDDGGGKDAHDI